MILATIALIVSLTQSPIPPGICPVFCNKWICDWVPCEHKKICTIKPCYKYPMTGETKA